MKHLNACPWGHNGIALDESDFVEAGDHVECAHCGCSGVIDMMSDSVWVDWDDQEYYDLFFRCRQVLLSHLFVHSLSTYASAYAALHTPTEWPLKFFGISQEYAYGNLSGRSHVHCRPDTYGNLLGHLYVGSFHFEVRP